MKKWGAAARYTLVLYSISFQIALPGERRLLRSRPHFFIGGLQRSMDVENCENCKAKSCKEPESVPYIVHEASMARMERQAKRLWIAVLLLIVMLVGTNAAWLYYESSFEDVVTTTTVESEQDGAGVNIFGGGDVEYVAESKDN